MGCPARGTSSLPGLAQEMLASEPLARMLTSESLALTASAGDFDLRGEVEWFDDQRKVAPFETATEGFTHVNAAITWRPLRDNPNVSFIVKADNIFDVTGRRHTSFTKDFVPLAGRNISASVRASF